MLTTLLSLGDWEPIKGWPIRVFNWELDWYVLLAFLLIVIAVYVIFVLIRGKFAIPRDERKEVEDLIVDLEDATGKERREALRGRSKPVKRLVTWEVKTKKILRPIATILLAIALIAVPVLSTTGSLIWATLFPSDNLNADSVAAKLAIGEAKENVVTLESEGAVLLKNDNNALPLDVEKEEKINIFGAGAFGMLYGGGGSGVFVTNATVHNNELYATRLEKALETEGFEYNPYLYNLVANYYESKEYKVSYTSYDIQCQRNTYPANTEPYIPGTCLPQDNEPGVEAYTRSYSELGGKTLLENALAYSDVALFCISRAGSEDGDLAYSDVQLTDEEADVIEMLKDNFEKVIILINSSNAMELESLDDDGVSAVLWVGHPGLTGNTAVAQILSGKINPSGKLADTWAYDESTAPSFLTFGLDGVSYYSNGGAAFQVYYEGIYVGYRYYVTRAMTDPYFDYDQYVQWSFGEGLSYTTFEKYISDYTVDMEKGTVSVQIAVTNTGDVAGKEVAEIYFTAPYTTGGVEKASVELAGFAKTNLIEPGDTYYARVEFDVRDMSSWDTSYNNGNGAYVLDKGDYEITLRDNAWKQTASNEGDTSFVVDIENTIVYDTDEVTGTTLENRFSDVEYGPNESSVVYLSRADWAGTYPKATKIDLTARQDVIDAAKIPSSFEDNQEEGDTPATNESNGLLLSDMRGLDYDDPQWDLLLNEMSLEEEFNLVDNGGFQTAKVDSIGKAQTYDDDGPASVEIKGVGYVSEVVIASSWNPDCANLLGQSLGKEGASMGLTGWYAPGLNTHRSALGGRNFEYYSEDPLLSGSMGAATALGCKEYGVYPYIKHFALNDQETERMGIEVWASEQAMREIYLHSFEITVKEGKATGLMSAFTRLGAVWSGASHALLTEVLRDEWGFRGVVVTDYILNSLMPVSLGLRAGNDLWLLKNTSYSAEAAYRQAPHDVSIYLRRACHNILYAVANSNAVWTEEEFLEHGIDRNA